LTSAGLNLCIDTSWQHWSG